MITCRWPYTHLDLILDCYGEGVSKSFNTATEENRCEMCCILCCPFACVSDIICFIPLSRGVCDYPKKISEYKIDYNSKFCKYMPRFPYWMSSKLCDLCLIGCDNPGIGSKDYQPSNNCDDCALCCLPCSIVFDIICCIPLIFGCLTIK